jgi:hypothetical protein
MVEEDNIDPKDALNIIKAESLHAAKTQELQLPYENT